MRETPEVPAWWTELQADFGAWLRARPDLATCPDTLVNAISPGPPASREARLALYRDQRDARLLGVLAATFPRLRRALGAAAMERLSRAQLDHIERLPDDLADLGVGLHGALMAALDGLAGPLSAALPAPSPPAALLREAASLDEAERRALRAPAPRSAAGALKDPNLRAWPLAVGCSLLRVSWSGLLEPGPFEALPRPRHVVVARTTEGVAFTEVDPVSARLLSRATRAPLGEIRAAILATCPPHLAAALSDRLNATATRAASDGWWAYAQD